MNYFLLPLLLAALLSLLLGCQHSAPEIFQCPEIACINGSVEAIDDSCFCACNQGYEGAACDTSTGRKRWQGMYDVQEYCSNGENKSYTAVINANNPPVVSLIGYRGVFPDPYSSFTDYGIEGIIEYDTIYINNQDYKIHGNTITVEGMGILNVDTITLNLVVNHAGSAKTCSLTLHRNR